MCSFYICVRIMIIHPLLKRKYPSTVTRADNINGQMLRWVEAVVVTVEAVFQRLHFPEDRDVTQSAEWESEWTGEV